MAPALLLFMSVVPLDSPRKFPLRGKGIGRADQGAQIAAEADRPRAPRQAHLRNKSAIEPSAKGSGASRGSENYATD